MEISYFGGNRWKELSREERLFCAHLYFDIERNTESSFIGFLNDNIKPLEATCKKEPAFKIKNSLNWEVAYEVCFYRDFLWGMAKDENRQIRVVNKARLENKNDGKNPFPEKRTFDLCLFSDEQIIIIEAKAHETFHADQIKSILEDRTHIHQMITKHAEFVNPPEVKILLLASSKYLNDQAKGQKSKEALAKHFESKKEHLLGYITWCDIYSHFSRNNLYERADKIFGERGRASKHTNY